MYLYLKKKNPKTFLVPCYDMDLIWHSHQVYFYFSIASPYYNGLQSSGISFFENHLWSSSVWSSFDPSEIHPEPVQINSLLSLSYFPTAKTLPGEKALFACRPLHLVIFYPIRRIVLQIQLMFYLLMVIIKYFHLSFVIPTIS